MPLGPRAFGPITQQRLATHHATEMSDKSHNHKLYTDMEYPVIILKLLRLVKLPKGSLTGLTSIYMRYTLVWCFFSTEKLVP